MLRTILIVFTVLFIAPITITNAAAASVEDARQFANAVNSQLLNVVNSSALSTDQKKKQLQQLLSQDVDIPWIGKFVLARGWQKATPEQLEHFMSAFKQYILVRYTKNFTDYRGSKYIITNVADAGDGEFDVSMKINTPGQQAIDASYHIRTDDTGQLKIADIIIDGVSQIITERSEFADVMQNNGIDSLIGDLENKTKIE